ncbi:MAG: NADH-quinone oxidoreductase subunit M, partial [Pseudomonadota bacterium]|nr:NADH-quinone oxidoreductase subunit M [Pseudomonadota bacterium]
MDNNILLSVLIWLPIFVGIIFLFLKRYSSLLGLLNILFNFIIFLISIKLLYDFDNSITSFQFYSKTPWFQQLGINYEIGLDVFSVSLVLLNCFIGLIISLFNFSSNVYKNEKYIGLFLICIGITNGVFIALDAILFYIFFEILLVPMFLIIGRWGSELRIFAAIKFFIYSFLGSIFLLISFIYIYQSIGSFSVEDFQNSYFNFNEQKWLFIAMAFAFAIKIPMFPVHTWLPDAHVQAPTSGSVFLAAILLKIGAFGILRYVLPVVPIGAMEFSYVMIILSLIAIVYIGLVALTQSDMKKLIAFSSISHMGFVTLGFFLLFGVYENTNEVSDATISLNGSFYQVISHGLVSAALFICVGIIYDKFKSKNILSVNGIINVVPKLSWLFVFFCLANCGLPGTSSFVGELLIIISSYKYSLVTSIITATTLVISAGYSLWMVKRVIFGNYSYKDKNLEIHDCDITQLIILGILVLMVIYFGVYPSLLIEFL